MGGPQVVTADRVRLWGCAATVLALATALAWALAHPELSPAMAAVRAIADGSAVLTLGLAVVPWLDGPRHRGEVASRAARPLVAASAMWVITELVRLVLSAAQAAATTVTRLPVGTAVEFVVSTTPGRSGLLSLTAATLVCVLATALRPTDGLLTVAAGVAACGIAARVVIGHLAENTMGAVAIAVHALAAALWCGTLAALAVTVSARGQWARVLPRFSQLSLYCMSALLIGGIAGALITIDSPRDLYASGYGRVLLAKIAVTATLLVLAWRNRSTWLPAARTHRITAAQSRSKSLTEVALMAVALTLAAALTVTG
ncbi:CopD family protein [soil metagenome]